MVSIQLRVRLSYSALLMYGRSDDMHIHGSWYLPKRTDFSKISARQRVQSDSRGHNRKIRCLWFRTPIEGASVCCTSRLNTWS